VADDYPLGQMELIPGPHYVIAPTVKVWAVFWRCHSGHKNMTGRRPDAASGVPGEVITLPVGAEAV
jgi:hypothetical protein